MTKPLPRKRAAPPAFLPAAREAYERGAPIAHLIRRLQLSRTEAEDLAPEEFEAEASDRNDLTGY